MVITQVARGTRTFQKKEHPPEQDIWYSQIPLDVMWGIYARQSTQAQLIHHAESTEMQTDDLEAWLVERGVREGHWKLFDADLGVSGTLRIDQRTGLQDLVELIKADIIKAVLVYQISRLFRDDTGVEYNTFAKICKHHNCVLVNADGMVFNFNNRMHMKMFRFLAEYAAEYIPQQIGLLHAARLRKARKGLYAGLGSVPRGYLVDYDKESETYKKFILYHPYQKPILDLLERFYALRGDTATFFREVEEMPVVFPLYEPWVDRRNIRDKKWKKAPNGYHISRKALISMLTNPIYIGWWIVMGDIISRNNHTALIPPEKQYLFWFAFDQLSEYTLDGTKNENRSIAPRRFNQKHTDDPIGLLKGCIECATGAMYVHPDLTSNPSYYAHKKDTKIYHYFELSVPLPLIDAAFTDRLFAHLRQTKDFDSFRKYANEIIQKRKTQQEILLSQLEEVESQKESILDERLAIRAHIRQQIKDALAIDEAADVEKLKEQFEKEAAPDFERLNRRSAKLDERKKEYEAKLSLISEEDQQFRTARTLSDFQTEVEKLAEVWHKKRMKEKRDFVNLLVDKVFISIPATHWIQMDIYWSNPTWADETLYLYREHGFAATWTDEEREIIREYYPTGQRAMLQSLLPDRSWNSIKKEATHLDLHCARFYRSDSLGEIVTPSDQALCNKLGISLDSRDLVLLVHTTKCDTPSQQPPPKRPVWR